MDRNNNVVRKFNLYEEYINPCGNRFIFHQNKPRQLRSKIPLSFEFENWKFCDKNAKNTQGNLFHSVVFCVIKISNFLVYDFWTPPPPINFLQDHIQQFNTSGSCGHRARPPSHASSHGYETERAWLRQARGQSPVALTG